MNNQSSYEYFWKPLRYHPVQSQLWNYTGRLAAIVAGRRSGKTVICRRKLILQLPIQKEWPNPIYYYVLPTYSQAKRVVWYDILNMIPPNWIIKNGINRTELSITTVFGSKLYLVGADKPNRLEGTPADFVMIDEASDQRPGLYELTILPMLSERSGICYLLGVPKRTGMGRIAFRDFFNRGSESDSDVASFHWKSADILTPEEINFQRSQMSEQDFAEQYEAQWADISSNVYYNFSLVNIRDDFSYDPAREIIVGCDFNVNPMCWCLAHNIDGKLYIFDEVFIRDTNTPSVMDHLHNKYYQHLGSWRFFGDASSRARKTSATRSDYLIIKNDARFGEKKVFFPHRNPNIRDRFAAVNGGFKNADQETRIYIHVKCKKLINDLNSVSYKEGTTDVENYSGTDVGHMSDGFGYMVHGIMPIRLESSVAPSIWSKTG